MTFILVQDERNNRWEVARTETGMVLGRGGRGGSFPAELILLSLSFFTRKMGITASAVQLQWRETHHTEKLLWGFRSMAAGAPVLGDQGLVTSLSVSAYPLVSENHVSMRMCRRAPSTQ